MVLLLLKINYFLNEQQFNKLYLYYFKMYFVKMRCTLAICYKELMIRSSYYLKEGRA